MTIQRDTEYATLEAIAAIIKSEVGSILPDGSETVDFSWKKLNEIADIIERFNAQADASSDERQPAKADNMSDGPSPAARPEDGKEGEGEAKKYKVSVEWLVSGIVEVDAESIEQAIADAYLMDSLPSGGEYVDGSFNVVEEFTYDLNEDV